MNIYITIIMLIMTFSLAVAEEKVTIGSQYDLIGETELRAGPSLKDERIVNQKATDKLKEIHYLSVGTSTTIKVTDIKGDWAKIEVVVPDYLAATHRGWLPLKIIKIGEPTQKKEGWIRHTSLVYTSKDEKSKPIGYIIQPSAVGVAADGSGWLRLIHGPVRHSTTDKFLTYEETPKEIFIQEKNFTEIMPAE